MISLDTVSSYSGAVIKVIGIGGGGGNAINNMINKGLSGVEFIAANTDRQALEHNLASVKVQVGKNITKGLGAGADPEVGKSSAEEDKEAIKQAIAGADMLFVTSGMGGGTGTGGAPLVAQIGKELGALVVGIVTKPFDWEGKKRKNIADKWLEDLRQNVDALIVISNQRLLEIIDENTSFKEAFAIVDEVLFNATKGISDIISHHGVVNVDFADVKTVMKGMGDSLMGIGKANGDNRAIVATKAALNSPILDGLSISGAKGILVNVTGSNLKMIEITNAVTMVQEAAGDDALLIHGVVEDERLGDEIMVTVVATGFNLENKLEKKVVIEEVTQPKMEETQTPTNPFTNSPYGNNQVVIGGNRPGVSNGFMRSPFGNGNLRPSSDSLDKSPRGENMLNKFDEPAFTRNEQRNDLRNEQMFETRQVPLGEQGSVKISKIKESTIGIGEKSKNVFSSEPTFLRKIMD